MRRALLIFVLVFAVAAGAGTWVVLREREPPVPRSEVGAYLEAWTRSEFQAMAALVAGPPAEFVADHERMLDDLRVKSASFTMKAVSRDGHRARATFAARLQLDGLGEWAYDGRLALVRRDDRWLVEWAPTTIHPELQRGHHLARTRSRPARAPILGSGNQPLSTTGSSVSIGVERRRVRDRTILVAAVEDNLGLGAGQVNAALDRPGTRPDEFIPLVEVSPDRFAELRPILEPVPGIVFRRQAGRAAFGEGFARHVLGRTGEVTAELLAKLGPPYMAGDVVGLDGIEAAFEKQLAGAPSGEVRLVADRGGVVKTLFTFAGTAPRPVLTTIDPPVQSVADRVVAETQGRAAIVAIDATSGAVLASASGPSGDFNRAIAGRYPPGSTFKVVTTSALLKGTATPSSTVECPRRRVVGGKPFTNFESQELGEISFTRAFTESCNTAFVALADKLGDDALADEAASFGFNRDYDIGLAGFRGRFPDPADKAETAAAAIGQARVEASPLHMASVAAAVAGGGWRPPRLVIDPAAPPSETEPMDATVNATLKQMMIAVVRSGSGQAAAVPGREVGGKTGTAEFGTGTPLPTHAWFIGFHRNVGFAVLVEGGGVGGRVAAPIAARFVSALPT